MKFVFYVLVLLTCLIQYPALAANPAQKKLPVSSTVETVHKDVTLGELLKAGGWTMVVLGLLSIIAMGLIIYDFMSLKVERLAPQKFTEELIQQLEAGDVEKALALCNDHPNIMSSIALSGFERSSKGRVIAREAMENTARKEVGRLWQNISYLGDIATIAPLLGLLGTVLGMIQAFNMISFAGSNLKPIMLVGGISKALVTTASGLIIAVPALAFYSYFRGKVQAVSDQVEAYASDIMKLVEEQSNPKNR